jgi:hypothetical protein
MLPSDPFGGDQESVVIPAIVAEHWYVEEFGLPWAGGSLDQPSIKMDELMVCRNARATVQKMVDANRKMNGSNT